MVVGVGGGIPISVTVEMIIMDAEACGSAAGSEGQTMIDAINVGVLVSKVISISSDGPPGIVAGNVIDSERIRAEKVHAVHTGVGYADIGNRCMHIQVGNGDVLHGAAGAVTGVIRPALRVIRQTRTIRGVADDSCASAVHDNVAPIIHANSAH